MNMEGAIPVSSLSRDEFHEIRLTGLGGSDIAAICGISPFKDHNPMSIWLLKRKLIVPDDKNETAPMRWGHKMESVIASAYMETTGSQLLDGHFQRNKINPWAFGSSDRIVLVNHVPEFGLEIKTTRYGKFWGTENWTDEIPNNYLTQVAWYTYVFDCQFWDVAVLIGGSEERYYRIPRNDKLISKLVEIGEQFWYKNVQGGVEPVIDESEAWAKYIEQAHPKDILEPIEGDTETSFFAEQLRDAKRAVTEAERRADEFINKIKAKIGDAGGVFGPGYKILWRKAKDQDKIDNESIVRDLVERFNLPPAVVSEMILKHSTTKPGVRSFRTYFTEEE